MTQSRRKGSVSEKDASSSSTGSAAAGPGRSQTPSRQLPDKKNAPSSSSGNNSSANALKGKMGTARSTSAPKQRGKSGSSVGSSSSSASLPPPLTRCELALSKMQKEAESKSDEELQMLLQQLLQNARFEDAAYLISASAFLNSKFKTSDVVRLMLEAKQFEQTAQLIRDMKLQSNQLLVTLFVKELVRCSQFHAAVRYAQEMVQNFGKKDFGPRDQERPSWTPQALIQAMLRAFQFKTALKFSKQFDLLDTFPALPLVANMFEARQWEDAISSVMEYRLFTDFPIEALIMKMLGERQWTLAVKCMGKIQAKELLDKYADALVREAARAGDFVIAVRYLNEYKLDQPENRPLMQHMIDCMITYSEMYKAIKYSIKFGLADTESAKGGDAAVSRYDTKKLILKAIEIGQFHVATLYIKKLRLKDEFMAELAEMEQRKQARLREFREFVGFRESQFSHPATQHQLYTLIGDKAAVDADLVELDPVTVDVVLSEVEEIIPKKKREVVKSEQKTEETGAGGTIRVFETTTTTTTVTSSGDASLQTTERQSRFNFARTSAPGIQPPSHLAPATAPSSDPISQERAHAPPPGLAQFAQSAAVRTEESSSSFNFAQFASALQGNAVPAPVSSSTHISALSPTPQQMQQNLQQQAAMYAQHAPMLNGNFSRGSVPPPPSFAPSFHQGNFMQNMNPNQAPPPSYMMPPPPPQPQQNLSGGGMNPSMDIASLAMQFHSSGFGGGGMGRGPGFGMSSGAPGNYPPQMPPQTSAGAPPAMNHLFPLFAPPPPPPQFAPPPRSSFKPSIGYTSVTTTRQKK